MKGYPVVTEEKVRYGDLDPYGHLNNKVFFGFFEQARLAYFRLIGLFDPMDPARGERNLVLAETSCRFVDQGHLDDVIRSAARTVRLGNSSLEMEHRLERDGKLLGEGRAVLVYFDFATGRPVRIPDDLRARIRAVEASAGNVVP